MDSNNDNSLFIGKMSKTNTTQEIAINWVQNAVNEINKQLAVEIERNGFDMDAIRKGKQKLERIVRSAEDDPRFVAETFTVQKGKNPPRIIMCVKWSPYRLSIERNSDAVAGAVKVNPKFGIKKNHSPLFVGQATEQEIEIEQRANEYMKKHNEEQLRDIKN